MSRFVVLAILVLMAVSAHSNPAPARGSHALECTMNQAYSLCGTMCEPSCDNPEPNPMFCPGIECTEVTGGCRCQKGYLRSNSGKCVLPQDC